jgi:hypothetical protein
MLISKAATATGTRSRMWDFIFGRSLNS